MLTIERGEGTIHCYRFQCKVALLLPCCLFRTLPRTHNLVAGSGPLIGISAVGFSPLPLSIVFDVKECSCEDEEESLRASVGSEATPSSLWFVRSSLQNLEHTRHIVVGISLFLDRCWRLLFSILHCVGSVVRWYISSLVVCSSHWLERTQRESIVCYLSIELLLVGCLPLSMSSRWSKNAEDWR